MKNLLLTFKLLFEKQISVIIFTICKYFNKNFTKVKRFIICPFYVRRKPSMIYFLFFEKHPVKEASWTLCTILWREQKEFSKRINLASVWSIVSLKLLEWHSDVKEIDMPCLGLAELRGEGEGTLMSVGLWRFHLFTVKNWRCSKISFCVLRIQNCGQKLKKLTLQK